MTNKDQPIPTNAGVLQFKRKDKTSHFMFRVRIGDYEAAQILQYIARVPHKFEQLRDNKGRFTKP